MTYSKCITILTPTYNRADYLGRLYESLVSQTNQDFQWLVIDDGSTDETEKIVSSFKGHSFELVYKKKKNGGKHTALNYSHPYIDGQFVCIVDSDDYLLPDAINCITSKINQYSSKRNIKVLVFQRGNAYYEPLCDSFGTDDIISNNIDFIVNGKRTGDCCEVISSDVLKEFPFPEYENEKFLGEGYLWCHEGFLYDTVYIPRVIYICEYLEGGLSKSGRKLRLMCPKGGMANCNAFFNSSNNRKVRKDILRKKAILFVCYGKFSGLDRKGILNAAIDRKMISRCYVLGLALYYYWKNKYKI